MSEARAFTPRVTVVPATLNRFTAMPISGTRKRRVAAYARVSTNQEEQLTSYEAQVDYYTQYIQSKAEWEYVKVYTDVDTPYGLSPTTNTDHLRCILSLQPQTLYGVQLRTHTNSDFPKKLVLIIEKPICFQRLLPNFRRKKLRLIAFKVAVKQLVGV